MTWFRPFALTVSLTAGLAAPVAAGPIISDPVGDTFAGNPTGPDVIGISADRADNPGFATFRVRFAGLISAPSVFASNSVTGVIDIDVDRNPATGQNPSLASLLAGAPPFNLGAELSIDLFSELFNPGFVDVTDGTGTRLLATVPITFTSNELTFLVPNSVFGPSSGTAPFSYAGVFGDFLAPSDRVPNGAEPLISTPEPTSVATFGILGVMSAGYVRRRRNR